MCIHTCIHSHLHLQVYGVTQHVCEYSVGSFMPPAGWDSPRYGPSRNAKQDGTLQGASRLQRRRTDADGRGRSAEQALNMCSRTVRVDMRSESAMRSEKREVDVSARTEAKALVMLPPSVSRCWALQGATPSPAKWCGGAGSGALPSSWMIHFASQPRDPGCEQKASRRLVASSFRPVILSRRFRASALTSADLERRRLHVYEADALAIGLVRPRASARGGRPRQNIQLPRCKCGLIRPSSAV